MRPRILPPDPSVLLGAAALGLSLVAVGPVAVAADSGPESTTDGGKTTIEVFEKNTGEDQYIPRGGTPQEFPEDENFVPSPGDAFRFNSDLLQDGRVVGTNTGTCTLITLKTSTHRCVVTNTFDHGTITIDEVVDFEESLDPFDVTIVSGTGAYAGATGTATVDPDDATDGENAHLTLTFSTAGQVSQVPTGGAAAGGGTGDLGTDTALLVGIGGLVTLAGLGALARGRRLAANRR